eukprot:gene7295-2257_t
MKVRAELPHASAGSVWRLLHDPAYRATWDAAMARGYAVARLSPNNDIGYYRMRLGWSLDERDFCAQRGWARLGGDEYIITSRSVANRACPEVSGVVRARSLLTAWYVRPGPGGGCVLTWVTATDPRGSVPAAVVGWATKQAAGEAAGRLAEAEAGFDAWLRSVWMRSGGGSGAVPGPWARREGWFHPAAPDQPGNWSAGALSVDPPGDGGIAEEERAARGRVLEQKAAAAAAIRAQEADAWPTAEAAQAWWEQQRRLRRQEEEEAAEAAAAASADSGEESGATAAAAFPIGSRVRIRD